MARSKGRFCPLRDRGSTCGLAQGSAHGGREFVHCKGFFYHDFAGKLSLEPRLVDIAGDENRPDSRMPGASLFEQLDSGHPRHREINDQQVDCRIGVERARAALPLETSMTLYPLSRNKSAVISRTSSLSSTSKRLAPIVVFMGMLTAMLTLCKR